MKKFGIKGGQRAQPAPVTLEMLALWLLTSHDERADEICSRLFLASGHSEPPAKDLRKMTAHLNSLNEKERKFLEAAFRTARSPLNA